MKNKLLGFLGALILFATAVPASAASITTVFSSNNQGSQGGGIYFDVTVGANDLLITGLATNTLGTLGSTFGLDIYTRSGTYSGNESSAAGWTPVASGVGTHAELNNPSLVDFTSFLLTAGSTYGFALIMDPSTAHHYTNGAAVFSNADLSILTGSATNAPFGQVFSPRTWNGTIFYTISTGVSVPEPGTLALLGLGLLGMGIRRRIKAS